MGARTIKTVIALTITLFLAEFFNLSILLAGISALGTMEISVYKSVKQTQNTLISNLLAAIFAITIGSIFGTNIIIVVLCILV